MPYSVSLPTIRDASLMCSLSPAQRVCFVCEFDGVQVVDRLGAMVAMQWLAIDTTITKKAQIRHHYFLERIYV